MLKILAGKTGRELADRCRLMQMHWQRAFQLLRRVIKGACQHLINDCVDMRDTRWDAKVLKQHPINSRIDFETYWDSYQQKPKKRLYYVCANLSNSEQKGS